MAHENAYRGFGFVRFHKMVWRHGGPWERFFLCLFLFLYAFLPAILAWITWGVFTSALPVELMISFVIALVSYGAFNDAFIAGLINSDFILDGLRLRLFTAHQRFLEETARFLSIHGEDGRFPGAVRWALTYWSLYFGLMALSIVFTWELISVFGPWTPLAFAAVEAPVALGCFIAFLLHVKRIQERAETLGFPLLEYMTKGEGRELADSP